MSSRVISNPILLINENQPLLNILQRADLRELLEELKLSWIDKSVDTNARIYSTLEQSGITEDGAITRLGELFFGRIMVDLVAAVESSPEISSKYRIEKVLTTGKNSATFLVKHKLISSTKVLKVLRPGAAENLLESLSIYGEINSRSGLVSPTDVSSIRIADVFGTDLVVEYLIFPYISGTTLRSFLNDSEKPLTPNFVISFIKQVSSSLSLLEAQGAYHGDLHDENIIVDTDSEEGVKFYLIDISYGMIGSKSAAECIDTDKNQFKSHIQSILRQQNAYMKNMSVRKFLGASAHFIVSEVLDEIKHFTFSSINRACTENVGYKTFLSAKEDFLRKKFMAPGGLKLLRYEEINSPEVAVQLFEPYPNIMNSIKQFCCTLISGHRGSGKSTYIASLAFFPKVENPSVNPKDIFGIYFPCRQGEFKVFSPEIVSYDPMGYLRVKHIFVLKIVRRTMESIVEAISLESASAWSMPHSCTELKSFMQNLIGEKILSYGHDASAELANLLSLCIRMEMKEIETLSRSESRSRSNFFSREKDLMEFFSVLRKTFPALSVSRFYILFDDAGTPNVPSGAQKVINDFIMASNNVFCIKISTEKYSYSLTTTEDKNLELDQDYFEDDISKTLFIGGKNSGADPQVLQEYFRKIVERRLIEQKYKSRNILDYLGDGKVPLEKLASILADRPTSAFYFGWTTVWQAADRTPRSLLEIVSEIFDRANIDQHSPTSEIHKRIQDRAIRNISEKRLKSLAQISGSIEINGETISLGVRIAQITSTIGTVFRRYLVQSKGKQRKDELLAIERNDSNSLSNDTHLLLKKMISFGILDDSRVEAARDDGVVKPIYVLNRIYCPAFRLGLRRDQHLRLSKQKFDELFLNPKKFLNEGTKRLVNGEVIDPPIKDLFDYE